MTRAIVATNSTDRTGLPMSKNHQETSPGRSKLLSQPESKAERRVAVVYYLSRNGQLQHPHFMEVPLSCAQGLQLRDVINTLNLLRGQGMAAMYSWSSKRSYRNGFVWQDLSDDDFVHPCDDHEYILKGSLLLEPSASFRSYDTLSSSTSKVSSELNSSSEDSNSPVIRRKNHSWTAFVNLDEDKVYKAMTTGEIAIKGANVSTQTDENRRMIANVDNKEAEHEGVEAKVLSREEVSPSLKSTCSKPLKGLDRSPGEHGWPEIGYQRVGDDGLSGRRRTCVLLMKLIGCGSKGFQ